MRSYFGATLLIILVLPLFVSAQGFRVEFKVEPGTLPGEFNYYFERIGEWFEINFLTLATKKKQEKKLAFASERLAEFKALLEKGGGSSKYLRPTLAHYENLLREAEDMTEKIIILDGREIALAEKLEQTTRIHEQVLAELLEEINPDFSGFVYEGLAAARIENEKIFKFMVKNYQQTARDIAKHQKILDEHLKIIKARMLPDSAWAKAIKTLIEEAEKFQKAGLNSEAYDFVKKAKNVIY